MAKAFGEQNPTQGEDAVSWQTWSDGAGSVPTIDGDADWGKLKLDLSGEEGRSAVYDLGSATTRKFTLTENRYGTGAETAILQIRGDTSSFLQDAVSPAWETYTAPITQAWRYVQVREITVLEADWVIPTSTVLIDGGAAPYNAVEPGDIIELEPGTRTELSIRDLAGTEENPIIIRNGDGQVVINDATGWYGIWIQNCQHFRLTGSEYGQTYGIQIARAQANGIIFQNKTEYFEIDHIEVLRVDGVSAISIQGQTTATTEPDYDYDLDGDIDADDGIVNRSNFTQHNFYIHDCHFDGGVGVNQIQMGIYVGNSNWDTDTTQPEVIGCHIHDVIVENITEKAIQCGSVVSGLDVHDNIIINADQGADIGYGLAGININEGCVGSIYNNWIEDTEGHGICHRGVAGKIYNNVIIRCGKTGTYMDAGIAVIPDESTSGDFYLVNNTIIDPVGNGIEMSSTVDGANYIQNNIIVNPGDNYTDLPAGTFTVDHNYTTLTIADVKFTNAAGDIYTLESDSPCRNAGMDASTYGIADDIAGTTRPQGAAYDQGAYEYDE